MRMQASFQWLDEAKIDLGTVSAEHRDLSGEAMFCPKLSWLDWDLVALSFCKL